MHQDGLDADLGIFRVGGLQDGFGPGLRPEAFDAPRTWSLVRTLLATHRVEWILLDQPLIDALAAHARRAEGWTQAQLATVFPAPGAPRLWERAGYLRHTAGHANHVHVHAVCSGPTSR
jgi:hypothetical protein